MNLRAETMRGRQPCLWHEKQERLRCGCESRELPQAEWPWMLVGCFWMKGKARPSEREWSKERKYRQENGRWGSGEKRHDSLLLVLGKLAQSTPSPSCWTLYRQWTSVRLCLWELMSKVKGVCMMEKSSLVLLRLAWGYLESAPGSATTSTDCLGWCWHSHRFELLRYLRIFANWHPCFPSSFFTVWTMRTRDAFPS